MLDCETLRLFERYQERVLLGRTTLAGATPEVRDRVEFHCGSWHEPMIFGGLMQIHEDSFSRLYGHTGIREARCRHCGKERCVRRDFLPC